MKKIILLVLILTNISTLCAQDRPKIGLVLSGGGARGAAHIGVIEALEEMQVPIDIIVGTSMGAVIGGLYAAGVPIQKIKEDFTHFNWEEVFSINIKRTDLYYRRKLDDDIFIIKNFIIYSKGKIHAPLGIVSGQPLYELFKTYLIPQEPIQDFNHLCIPFRAVATDLLTGDPVVIENGDLALSLLASMAVPGIINPIPTKGKLLVDGGVSANLPVEAAKSMGADILIVVDVGTPLSTRGEIIDLTNVLEQLTNILTNRNVEQSKCLLTSKDVLLIPELNQIGTSDFSLFGQAIAPGKNAVYQHENQLRRLASPSPFQKKKKNTFAQGSSNEEEAAQNGPIMIEEIKLINETKLLYETFFSYLDFEPGIPTTPEEIKEKIDKLYGLSIFDRIYYGMEDCNSLSVFPKQDDPNPLFIQGSLFLETDFQGTNTFNLLFGITNRQMNPLLGEWRLVGNIGQNEGIFAEYYQPLTMDLAWFINPTAFIVRIPEILYFDFDPIDTILFSEFNASFSLGRNFSNLARIRAFAQFEYDDVKHQTGPDFFVEGNSKETALGLSFEWDNIDSVYFPHRGIKGNLTFLQFVESFAGDSNFSQLKFDNLAAISKGRHSFVLSTEYNRTLDNTPSFASKFFLGGLFELTGLLNQELIGNNSGLISAIYYYQWKKINIIPNRPLPIYVGASLEGGKVWGEPNLSSNRFIKSASAFLGANSIFGPIYLAAGLTDTGQKAVHLTLRPVFR